METEGQPQGRRRVDVLVDEPFDERVSAPLLDLIRRTAEVSLDREHSAGPDLVTVLVTGDETLRDLNRQFNGEDEVTDVLSFNETPGWLNGTPPQEADDWAQVPGEEPRLGDIVISLPQVERQSAEAGNSVERELAMLTAHGVLHLLGYDHAEPEEERVMFGKTDEILALVFND